MNAMAEARMVAASTQRPLDFEQGAPAGRDRITFSSQGSRKSAHMFAAYQKIEAGRLELGAVEMIVCVSANLGNSASLLEHSV
jgi:hypothetical protein